MKSFETETDASGVFTLPAWDTGTRVISGTMGNKFPMIGFYKPGYDVWYDNLSSVARYGPKSGIAGTEVEIKDGVRDWTKFPHRLVPLQNERDRSSALDDSGTMMMIDGECGWESYAKLLLVQHNELREWMRRNIPPEQIRPAGTLKPQFAPPPGITLGSGRLYSPSRVEALLNRYNSDKATWRCANPNDRFAIRK